MKTKVDPEPVVALVEPVAEVLQAEDYICPSCGVTTFYRCRLCGATRSTNAVSGNVIWMRNGRVLAAFRDAAHAWVRMAERYGIPAEQWPEQFRGTALPKSDPFSDDE